MGFTSQVGRGGVIKKLVEGVGEWDFITNGVWSC